MSSSSSDEDYTLFDNQVIKMQSNESQVLLTKWEDPSHQKGTSEVARLALVHAAESLPALTAMPGQTPAPSLASA